MTDANSASNPQKVHIETWGCQMNVADSEEMLALLQNNDFASTDDPTQADLIVLNTCHIREKAKHKVLSRLGVLRDIQKSHPKIKIAVAGCVAQAEGERLFSQAPNIDILIGPGKITDLPRLLAKQKTLGQPVASLGFETQRTDPPSTQAHPNLSGKTEISRFVNIAQGCNNFCTFCVVPFTRGREISKPPQTIIDECQRLVTIGAKEITLLGQNVNSYGLDLDKEPKGPESRLFVNLLRHACAIPGLERLRFTTSNPHDFTYNIAQLFKDEPKLGKYLHLPVQSGSNEILDRMRRKVTREQYFERVGWLREIPDFALSTDLIVGFPGESDDQFEETVALVKKVGFSFIYSFKYSPRSKTAAARFRSQVPEEIKSKRLKYLNEVQDAITVQQNSEEVGKERTVLIHYKSKKLENCYYGRTEQFRLVKVPSPRDLVGRTIGVRITESNKTGLVGVPF